MNKLPYFIIAALSLFGIRKATSKNINDANYSTIGGSLQNDSIIGGSSEDEIIPARDIVVSINSNPIDTTKAYDTLFKFYADKYKIDWKLLKAHAIVESSLRASAVNPSDPSYGLMQVLCKHKKGTTACINKFPAVTNWAGMTTEKLKDPETNISVGAQIVKWNLKHAKGDTQRAISLYNHWNGGKITGAIPNPDYVAKVNLAYSRIKD